MTVLLDTLSASYIGDGAARVFPIPFGFLDLPAHLVVTRTSPVGAVEVLVYGAHWEASIPADDDLGRSVRLLTGTDLLAGWTLTITRQLPYTQPTDFSSQHAFSPEVHETALDRLEMQIQQLAAQVSALSDRVDGIHYSDPDLGAGVVALAVDHEVEGFGRVLFGAIAENDGGYDPTTSLFTAPAAGRYRVHASVSASLESPAGSVRIGLRSPGDYEMAVGTVGAPAQNPDGDYRASSELTATANLNAGDELEIFSAVADGLSVLAEGTRLEIHRV